jgi:ribosomal protein L1
LNQASKASYFIAGNGPNYSVKIGRLSMQPADIARNLEAILGNILGNLLCWDQYGFETV